MITSIKQMIKIDSEIVAEYILFKYGPMSHLKLQKLLYYVQAYHLAYFGEPLFDDDFEAWVHGPVSRALYEKHRTKSVLYDVVRYELENGKPNPELILTELLTSEQVELINEVLDEYSKLNSFELENETHGEAPWIEARKGFGVADRCNAIISKERMKEYYSTRLNAEA